VWNKKVIMDPEQWQSVLDVIPDVRDGLTRTERLILYLIHETQKERNGRNVPTVMLYGRVLEYVDMSEAELHVYLDRLGVRGDGTQ
tara:strand:- start:270 stop:527 length:258 start_codon:yes stop_codon:yes gene_type:complete